MLRINLLPDYINDKNKVRNLGIVWGLILAASIAGLMVVNSQAANNLELAKQDQAAKEDLKKQTDGLKQQVTEEKNRRAQIEAKQTFVKNAKLYNDGWAEAFETIRDVTPTNASIILKSMSLDKADHKTVSLTGFGNSEDTIVAWWISLRNNTALFDHVNFNLVPHSYAPEGGSSAGGIGGPGSGGNTKMQNFNNIGNASMGGMQLSASTGGGSAFGGAGGGASDTVGKAELRGKQGYNFTAAVVLKMAIAGGLPTPVWSGGAAPAAGSPMGGMGGPGSGGPMSGGMRGANGG